MGKKENTSKEVLGNDISKIGTINYRFHRISSMLLDHIIMTMIIVFPMILLMILVSVSLNIISFDHQIFSVIFFSMLFIYVNKDFFTGKSPAKRILGYQVVHWKTGQPATELQCFVRNLTLCFAWPLEIILSYLNPERRIGDYIANTKVVRAEKEKLKSILNDFRNKKLRVNFLIILVIGVVYFYGLSLIMPNLK